MTRQQAQIMEFIRSFIAEHGYSPSYEEIGKEIGVVRSAVKARVDGLVSLGRIARTVNRARSIEVIEPINGGPDVREQALAEALAEIGEVIKRLPTKGRAYAHLTSAQRKLATLRR